MAFPVQQAVSDFHKKFGHPVRDELTIIPQAEADMAFGFIEEELSETWEALYADRVDMECGEPGCCSGEYPMYGPDLIEVADGLGDVVWTAYGLALRMGIDLDAVLREIAASNMTKEPNGQGKIKKGPGYVPPRIAFALELPEDGDDLHDALRHMAGVK